MSTEDRELSGEEIVAAFGDRAAAEAAVGRLVDDGFAAADISVLAAETALRSTAAPAADHHVRNVVAGALEGTIFGALVGLENLVLGASVIPIVALGPLASYAGDRISARYAHDLPHLEAGRVLVILRAADPDAAARAVDALSATHPHDLHRHPSDVPTSSALPGD